ncbi:MAG: lipase family protein [Leptolyngbya sp. SIO1D8]|nr:lipase family protein [Leptolyngbya sp. SIO1D8]
MLDKKLALTCARLSRAVYTDFDSVQFEDLPGSKAIFLESEDEGKTDTQVAVLQLPETQELYIVFRGTDHGVDWMNNFQFRQQIYPYVYGDESGTDVRFHRGFMAAYLSIRDYLQAEVRKYPNSPITITGHSLGGAVATIAALDLQYNITQHTGQSIQLYTFGAPRVGNSALINSFRQRVPKSYRFVYGWDIVTRIPRAWQGYDHVPEEQRLGNRWTWKIVSRRFKDHEIINYIEALEKSVIPLSA